MGIKGTPILETLLQDMMPEESGYTIIEAVRADYDGKIYVDIEAPIRYSPKGLKGFILPVERYGPGVGEYNFDFRNITEPISVFENPLVDQDPEGYQYPNCSIFKLDDDTPLYTADDTELEDEELEVTPDYDLPNSYSIDKDTEYKPEIPQSTTEEKLFPEDKNKFPKTHSLRKKLNEAVKKENFEEAEKIKQKINSTQEKL